MAVKEIDIFPLGVGGRLVALLSAGPASYVAGGFDPGFPNGTLIWVGPSEAGGFDIEVDYTNKKIKILYPQGGSDAGSNDGTGTTTTGATAITGTAADLADINSAPGKEVEAAKDLSATTFRMLALVRT